VYRMAAPDGLTGWKALPRLDWAWSDNPRAPVLTGADCMNYKKEISAADIMKYMVGVLQVEFVKDDGAVGLAEMRKNAAANQVPGITNTIDNDYGGVRYHINNIEINEELNVFVHCSANHLQGAMNGQHYCSAQVSRQWAPKGKWSAATYDFGPNSYVIDQQWAAKFNAVISQQIQQAYASGNQILQNQMDQSNRQLNAQQNAFNQAQDMRQKQRENFDATLQRGTDMSMKQAATSANANHRAADDWADYSLNQQKRLDPNTGKISKDSSAYSYAWVNEQGKRIQTNDVNDNPNGNGSCNWTLQQSIH